ncbi:rod shape-determining protein MreD [candidate division WOR-3 bacterium]|nr:rod shape-determining protein MreD [candidate division WOR-3 bacterium]
MRTFFAFVLLYLLFMIQASVNQWWPDLVLLGLVVVSLHENRLASTLAGAFAGLCLDVTSPALLGAHLATLAATGYGVAVLRSVFYRARWATLLLTAMALVLKWAVVGLTGAGLPAVPALLTSSALTLLLAPLAELGLAGLLYHGWQPA